MTGKGAYDPKWNLERRESSGFLVWRKDAPQAKVRFRFDVEVVEFEKHPFENKDFIDNKSQIDDLKRTLTLCAFCMLAVAVSVLLPWYFIARNSRF